MLDVPARILAREKILSFSSARLPTRSNYLPPTREKIKERGGKEAKKQRERERKKNPGAKKRRERERENQIPGRRRRGRVMYGEREGSRVSVRVRENIVPISGRRVSRYVQRVITLANPLRSCAYRRPSALPSYLIFSLHRTVPTHSSSRSNGAAPTAPL